MNKHPSFPQHLFSFIALGVFGFAFALQSHIAGAAEGLDASFSANACQPSEKWTFSKEISKDWRFQYEQLLSQKVSSVRAFSEALALRAVGTTPEEVTFAEYWVSRALFNSKLLHIAYNGFTQIASREPTESTAGIQAAAMECLLQIHHEFPTLALDQKIWPRLTQLAAFKNPALKPQTWKVAEHMLRVQIADNASNEQLKATLALLKGGGAYESFANGLYAVYKKNHADSVKHLEAFIKSTIPSSLEEEVDQVRLLVARAHYMQGNYDPAIDHLKWIEKNSNSLAEALTDLAWTYLQSDRLREAIGTSINLQSGGLRRAFAPESPMIMAMALNEICQYPESVKAISLFRSRYKQPYYWLKGWYSRYANKRTDFYRLTVDFLKMEKKKTVKYKVPELIASEWTRSPLFIARQDEINLIFDEAEDTKTIGQKGAVEQYLMAKELLKFTRDLKARYKLAVIKLKPGEALPATIQNDLEKLRRDAVSYRRFRKAAPVWHRILAAHLQQVKPLETELIRQINTDLKALTIQMLQKLEQVAETNELIEVEIYNGASDDIIWQNAHPDYGQIAKEMKAHDRDAVDDQKVYNWGYTSGGLDGSGEIWEDELGSFKADLYDNCNNKDKYLAIKVTKGNQNAQR